MLLKELCSNVNCRASEWGDGRQKRGKASKGCVVRSCQMETIAKLSLWRQSNDYCLSCQQDQHWTIHCLEKSWSNASFMSRSQDASLMYPLACHDSKQQWDISLLAHRFADICQCTLTNVQLSHGVNLTWPWHRKQESRLVSAWTIVTHITKHVRAWALAGQTKQAL